MKRVYEVIGWSEYIAIPSLKISAIKAKVDTGAATSSLHATNLEYTKKKGKLFVAFRVPIKDKKKGSAKVEAEVLDMRVVKSSNGKAQIRPVIQVEAEINNSCFTIEITLSDRSMMGFPMLVGRQAMKKRFLVNPSRSFMTVLSKTMKAKKI